MELDPDKFEFDWNPPKDPVPDEEIYEIFEKAGWVMADLQEQAKFEAWKACKRMRSSA
jgi:hypothetical protein